MSNYIFLNDQKLNSIVIDSRVIFACPNCLQELQEAHMQLIDGERYINHSCNPRYRQKQLGTKVGDCTVTKVTKFKNQWRYHFTCSQCSGKFISTEVKCKNCKLPSVVIEAVLASHAARKRRRR